MAERKADVSRKTKETDIALALNLDGSGLSSISTGVGFLDHMLELLSKHGLFDMDIKATGDTHVDAHHTVEDIGICLGEAIKKALGDKKGITRFGQACVPMDEALAQVMLDISGRGYCVCCVEPLSESNHLRGSIKAQIESAAKKEKTVDQAVDDLMQQSDQRQLLEEFARALATNAGITLHINVPYGQNTHHMVEGVFKALGRALRQAIELDPRQTGLPSTKGLL